MLCPLALQRLLIHKSGLWFISKSSENYLEYIVSNKLITMQLINPKVMYNSDSSLVLSLSSIQFNIEYINGTIILNEPNELLEQWI